MKHPHSENGELRSLRSWQVVAYRRPILQVQGFVHGVPPSGLNSLGAAEEPSRVRMADASSRPANSASPALDVACLAQIRHQAGVDPNWQRRICNRDSGCTHRSSGPFALTRSTRSPLLHCGLDSAKERPVVLRRGDHGSHLVPKMTSISIL